MIRAWIRSGALLALLTLTARADGITDAHVEEALAAAGDNRAELQKVLDHFEGDADKLAAARFLIANMPGHGYVLTRLADKQGRTIEYDPLAYGNFKEALAALDALEEKHGELEFKRDRRVEDVGTITSGYLIRHIDRSFAAWKRCPEALRVGFDAYLNYVLPYRGSQEPIEDWLGPLMERYAHAWEQGDLDAVCKWIGKDLRGRVKFNERFYLHPTDQGFSEMIASGQGRCEDLTNLRTYAMRAVAIATAADFTPYWAHRDNNHAWNVRLDRDGRGFAKANAHAAKVYRKTYAIQRDNLCFRLPEGREAPNRFLSNRFYIDVTDQYAPTTDVTVRLRAGGEKFAYLCVFNGGEWRAIHWARVDAEGRATFDRMGRNIVYLPAVHDGEKLVPAAPPLVLHRDGTRTDLAGAGAGSELVAVAVHPRKVSPDTNEVTPVSRLAAGKTYVLKRWENGWRNVAEVVAGEEPLRFPDLDTGTLYWLVAKESRRLERVFTIVGGRQRFW